MKELLLHRNRAAILTFELVWGIGAPLIAVMTLLPGYFKYLGVANVWIGVLPALQTACTALVQPVSAYALPVNEKRLGRIQVIYALGAGAFAVLGMLVLMGMASPTVALIATLAALTIFAAALGGGDPHYLDFIVAIVEPEQRGRYFGLRFMAFGIGGIAGGVLAERVLHAFPAPLNFGWSFLIGGVIYMVSTLSLRFYRAEESVNRSENERPAKFRNFLAERLVSWLHEHEFRWFIIASSFFIFAAGGFPFLSLLLKEKLHEGDAIFGLLGAVFMASNLMAAWVLGLVTDRFGARRSFALSIVAYGLGVLGCLLFDNRVLLMLSYFMAAVWFPGQYVAGAEIALRITRRAPASEMMAVKMAALAPAQILGPILIGAALDAWDFQPVLLMCLLFLSFALLALWRGSPLVQRAGQATSG